MFGCTQGVLTLTLTSLLKPPDVRCTIVHCTKFHSKQGASSYFGALIESSKFCRLPGFGR